MKFLIFLLLGSYVFAQEDNNHSSESRSDSSTSDLALVLDISSEFILNLKRLAPTNLLNKLKDDKENNINNYILVQFDNKDVKNTTHKNIDTFSRAFEGLASTNIRGGKTPVCEGMSLGGIKRALELVSPKSLIIVFTDGKSNDVKLLQDILSELAAKQTRVLFILTTTAKCEPQSAEYGKIAHASNGQIFEIDNKDESIKKILDYLQASIGFPQVDLLAIDEEINEKKPNVFQIPEDKTLNEIFVTISAPKNFSFEVTDWSDNKPKSLCSQQWKTNNTQMCRVQKFDKNRKLKLTVNPSSSYSLRVSATSGATFSYGFQTFSESNSKDEIYSLPVEGKANTFIVKLNDPSLIASLDTVNIIPANNDHDGFSLSPALNDIKSGLYYGTFEPRNSDFRLQIIGKTVDGSELQRFTPVLLKATSENEKAPAKGINFVPKDKLETTAPTYPTTQSTETEGSSESADNQNSESSTEKPTTSTKPADTSSYESNQTTESIPTTSEVETTTHHDSSASKHSSLLATILTVFFVAKTVICY